MDEGTHLNPSQAGRPQKLEELELVFKRHHLIFELKAVSQGFIFQNGVG